MHAAPLQSLLAPPPSLHADTHSALDAQSARNVAPLPPLLAPPPALMHAQPLPSLLAPPSSMHAD
eukprot:3240534-Rhodomonas_salina.1